MQSHLNDLDLYRSALGVQGEQMCRLIPLGRRL